MARSTSAGSAKAKAPKADSDMDSDEDDDAGDHTPVRPDNNELKDAGSNMLSPEDARRQDEVAEGVQKIRVSTPTFLVLLGS